MVLSEENVKAYFYLYNCIHVSMQNMAIIYNALSCKTWFYLNMPHYFIAQYSHVYRTTFQTGYMCYVIVLESRDIDDIYGHIFVLLVFKTIK